MSGWLMNEFVKDVVCMHQVYLCGVHSFGQSLCRGVRAALKVVASCKDILVV